MTHGRGAFLVAPRQRTRKFGLFSGPCIEGHRLQAQSEGQTCARALLAAFVMMAALLLAPASAGLAPPLRGIAHYRPVPLPALTCGPSRTPVGRCPVPRAGLVGRGLLSEAASDQWLLYTVLTAAASVGYRLGVTTRLGRLATGPICAMGLTFVAAGTGTLPPASAQVSAAQGLAVRIATPLLLFGANLRAIASRAGRLLPSFMLGTLGTALGTLPS